VHLLIAFLQLSPAAADLNSPQDRYGSGFGKPKFPDSITGTTILADLVGSDSWYTFETLHLDSRPTFLNKGMSDWESSDEYLAATNDGAERGMKLRSDRRARGIIKMCCKSLNEIDTDSPIYTSAGKLSSDNTMMCE